MQSTYDFLLNVLHESSTALRRLLAEFRGRPRSNVGTDTLDFIETMAGFHKGYLPGMARPRSQQKYDQCLGQYTQLLKALCVIMPSIQIIRKLDGVHVTAPAQRVNDLYNRFDIDRSIPLNDLFVRMASSFRTVQEHPRPLFQYKFIDDLPLEILVMIVNCMDDQCAVVMSQSCRGWRMLCVHRVGVNAFFRMHYDMRVLHRPAPATRDELHGDVIEAMDNGREKALALIKAYQEATVGRLPLKFVSFENEWEALWPAYLSKFAMLPQTGDLVFEAFYNGIITLLASRPSVSHLRLSSLSMNLRIISHIQSSPNIVRLTLHRIPNQLKVATHSLKMHNVRYLGLGFHGSPITNRNQWRALTYFPYLTQLFAYSIDPSETALHYPHAHTLLRVVHRLETLHIDDSLNHILTLISWLEDTAKYERRPGNLRRVKINSRFGIPKKDTFRLINALSRHHPNLRILVLEGLASVPLDLATAIRLHFPKLESLSLVRRAALRQTENKLCDWEAAVYQYAQAFQGFQSLRHLETNMLCAFGAPGPSALDTLIAVVYGYDPGSTHGSCTRSVDGDEFDIDVFSDGASIAVPFASLCPSLESFALRAGPCYYSCEIERRENGTFHFVNTRSLMPHNRFETWNPAPGTTW